MEKKREKEREREKQRTDQHSHIVRYMATVTEYESCQQIRKP